MRTFLVAMRLGATLARDAVCFDLDGTLLDPRGSIRQSIDHAVTSHGHRRFAPDEVLVGMPLRHILATRTSDADDVESMVEAFRRHFTSEAWRLVRFYDGAQEALQDIRGHGFRIAVVTTKGEQEAEILLRNLGVRDVFDTVVGDDDRRPLKPDPAPVLEACHRLEAEPRDACMVGDTRFDVDAGRRAGAYTIGVRWGAGWDWGRPPDRAHVLVEHPAAFVDALLEWRNGVAGRD